MKLTISPLLAAGLVIFVVLTVIDRVITPVPPGVMLPLLVVAVVLIVLGGLRPKRS